MYSVQVNSTLLTRAKVWSLYISILRVAVERPFPRVRDFRTGASIHPCVSGHVEFQGKTLNLSSIIPIT